MNKRQKIVQQQFLNDEKVVIKRLEQVYNKSLQDINGKISNLDTSIATLQKIYASVGDDEVGELAAAFLNSKKALTPEEAKETLQSMIQSKVYQKKYQEALKKQVGGVLDTMQEKQFEAVSDYLNTCYENGFIGAMYDLQGQGIPLAFPLDQEAMVRAVQLDSKISQGLYTRLGEDIALLKKKITAQVSRGISSGMTFKQVAQQLAGASRIGFNNAVRIARTEGHRIQCQSTMDAAYKAKEKGADIVKQWDAALDDRTRESHAQVDGEIRELDKPFSNGLMFPSDPSGAAGEVINCRCALLQRAKWALDEDELAELKERAAYFGLDKSESFEEYKKNYLKATEAQNVHTSATSKTQSNGIINKSDESVFDDIINKQVGMTKNYQDVLNKKYAGGSSDAKKAFNKYVPNDSVADSAHTGTAHFLPADGKVYMNFAVDAANPRGAGSTFFHEHGHYIDFVAKPSGASRVSLANSTFGNLLQSDYKAYIDGVKKAKGYKKIGDAYFSVSMELMDDKHHSISDLYDALSGGKCSGKYGHGASYWKNNSGAIEREAFAHMFEASFDTEKQQYMKQYFPNAYAEFEKLIKGVI